MTAAITNAVADAPVGDLFADPHGQERAGGQRHDGHYPEEHPGLHDDWPKLGGRLVLEIDGDGRRLDDGERHGRVAGVLVDLLAAFFLALEPFQVREHRAEKLEHD
jgi:hypothetical protein